MKKNRILFLLLLIGISVSAFAKKVEIADARLIAKNTYFEQVNRHAAVPYEAIAISREYVENYNNHDVYYIFNINDKGFVIILQTMYATQSSDFLSNHLILHQISQKDLFSG